MDTVTRRLDLPFVYCFALSFVASALATFAICEMTAKDVVESSYLKWTEGFPPPAPPHQADPQV